MGGTLQKMRALAVLLCVGCTHYQAKPITLSAIASAQASHSMAARCIVAAHRNGTAGWTEAALIGAAECFNPALARAKAATRLAAANGGLARQYPGLALVLSAEYARNAPEASKWLHGLSLELPLDFGARKAVRLEAAVQTQLLSALENTIAQRAVAAEIGLSVDAIRAAQEEQALLKRRAQHQQAWLSFVAQRIVEGQIALTERLKPQQDLLVTQTAVLRAQSAERAARSQLAQSLGLPLAQVLSLSIQATTYESRGSGTADEAALQPDASTRQAALLARPELLRALGQYQLAELALRLELARQYPELRLNPGYIWERGLVKLPLALGAALPPLDGNRAAIAVAESARELAARELEWVQANISSEIDLAVANLQAVHAAYTLGVQQLESANRETTAAHAVFDAGELDQLGRLTTELHLSDVELMLHSLAVAQRNAQRTLALALAIPTRMLEPN
jgi:outer membrane protein TolC